MQHHVISRSFSQQQRPHAAVSFTHRCCCRVAAVVAAAACRLCSDPDSSACASQHNGLLQILKCLSYSRFTLLLVLWVASILFCCSGDVHCCFLVHTVVQFLQSRASMPALHCKHTTREDKRQPTHLICRGGEQITTLMVVLGQDDFLTATRNVRVLEHNQAYPGS